MGHQRLSAGIYVECRIVGLQCHGLMDTKTEVTLVQPGVGAPPQQKSGLRSSTQACFWNMLATLAWLRSATWSTSLWKNWPASSPRGMECNRDGSSYQQGEGWQAWQSEAWPLWTLTHCIYWVLKMYQERVLFCG